MSAPLEDRLDQILPRITSDELLSSEGIGNEIACYIFDYPAQKETEIRKHLEEMMERLASRHSELRVLHLNLLDVILAYLKQRGLFEKTLEMQATKDSAAVLRALKGPVSAEKIRDFIAAEHAPGNADLLLLSGVGSAWPMLRAHSLLNCLHPVMGSTPLVLFYPGTFDGTTLRLFGQITTTTSDPGTKPYYRAFMLVPGGTEA